MIRSTQIVRLDGLILCGSVDDEQAESALVDIKAKVKKLIRMFSKNSANEASIESDQFTIHYVVKDSVIFLCICDQSYPRKLAFTYLSDISSEFTSMYPSGQYLSPTAKSYGYIEFDTYIQKAKRSYQDSRATQNLDKLNDDLKDVTKVMTKNIEELLYRGDSLDKMGEMSGRLREDSRKYKKAAVRINWNLLISKYGPIGGLLLIMTMFIWWRFF
ncbi:transport protein sec22 [Venturia nashicola]|uniref:Protein transport protein SEC22 n=1 Tax=Venturia nashicola TaxID=86259 RepID=A0A4Z1NV59_9PEZI|nr:transport protein sec22 [Venturia nashicola]